MVDEKAVRLWINLILEKYPKSVFLINPTEEPSKDVVDELHIFFAADDTGYLDYRQKIYEILLKMGSDSTKTWSFTTEYAQRYHPNILTWEAGTVYEGVTRRPDMVDRRRTAAEKWFDAFNTEVASRRVIHAG